MFTNRNPHLVFVEGTGDDENTGSGGDDATSSNPADDLGDKGESALRKEREARRKLDAEVRRLRAVEKELQGIKDEGATAQERALAEARREAAAEANAAANSRILRAEARAIAGTLQFHDPAQAVRLLDLPDHLVNDEGEVDEGALRDLLNDLAKTSPYLVNNREDDETRRPASARRAGLAGTGGQPEPTDADGRLRAGLAAALR